MLVDVSLYYIARSRLGTPAIVTSRKLLKCPLKGQVDAAIKTQIDRSSTSKGPTSTPLDARDEKTLMLIFFKSGWAQGDKTEIAFVQTTLQ